MATTEAAIIRFHNGRADALELLRKKCSAMATGYLPIELI